MRQLAPPDSQPEQDNCTSGALNLHYKWQFSPRGRLKGLHMQGLEGFLSERTHEVLKPCPVVENPQL